ncbi:sigma-70 family RNA polymerase sigma factor [Rhodobacter sp. SGA-6-6]|uniref:sigma-70 family RNA polymerase sigma factor n=1 Tax=Rhodobacter sp. SGA-6-6 TaxID=2710882 RepID=UPI0013EB87BC|nr:sigma-70 family RNA polymerase sigma factor [Rhodobacter sp. SGA-6-6]NGM47577.1 sigma-70 family RNA polymerase sigma factor [Rhodobacter sp. SGA-6-6]
MDQMDSLLRDQILSHLPVLRAFATGLTGNPDRAADLVQDTMVKVWSRIDSFRPGTSLRGWLFTILRNTWFSELRKRRREVADPEGLFAARLTVMPAHDGVLALREFHAAFARLSAEHQQALTLVGALGLSYKEAAERSALAVGTVKSRVSRARSDLLGQMGISRGESPIPSPDRSFHLAVAQA